MMTTTTTMIMIIPTTTTTTTLIIPSIRDNSYWMSLLTTSSFPCIPPPLLNQAFFYRTSLIDVSTDIPWLLIIIVDNIQIIPRWQIKFRLQIIPRWPIKFKIQITHGDAWIGWQRLLLVLLNLSIIYYVCKIRIMKYYCWLKSSSIVVVVVFIVLKSIRTGVLFRFNQTVGVDENFWN